MLYGLGANAVANNDKKSMRMENSRSIGSYSYAPFTVQVLRSNRLRQWQLDVILTHDVGCVLSLRSSDRLC